MQLMWGDKGSGCVARGCCETIVDIARVCVFSHSPAVSISLGLIQNVPILPTFCYFVGFFYKLCSDLQTCHHIGGGGGAYLLKSVRKGSFRNVGLGGGRG